MRIDSAEVGAGVADADLSGQTVLVTGSTGGIGRETALALGRLGATVVVHGRDAERGETVVDRLRETAGEGELRTADFASQAPVRDLARGIREDHDRLDALVNNAGGFFRSGRVTDDGVEVTTAVNHLAPYLLTNLLWPLLARAEGRVVTVSSDAHRGTEMDFDRFRTPGSGWAAYARSKLANVLFTRELARRAAGAGVLANALHPGAIPGSGFTRNLPAPVRVAATAAANVPLVSDLFVTDVVEGAETPVYLVADPDLDRTGEYFVDCRPRRPSRAARDDRTARRLWDVSADLTGLDPDAEPTVPAPDGDGDA